MMRSLVVLLMALGPAAQEKRVEPLRVSWGLPTALDPHRTVTLADSRFVTALFEGLTTHEADGVTPAPGMAERWSVSADGRTWTFTLREARWSNGDPVAAADFVYAWRRALRPGTGCPYVVLFRLIRNVGAWLDAAEADGLLAQLDDLGKEDRAAAVRRLAETARRRHAAALRRRKEETAAKAAEARPDVGEEDLGFVAVDPRTLRVSLERRAPWLPDLLSFMTFVPLHEKSVTANGSEWTEPGKIVTNGPYRLASSSLVNLKFRRSESYWDPRTRNAPAEIVAWLNSPEVALEKFEGGRLDWLTGEQIPDGKRAKVPGLVRFDTWGTFFLRLNVLAPPFDKAPVRRAVAQGIDRTAVAGKAGLSAARTLVPPGFRGYPERAPLGYDKAAAMEALLRAAGFDLATIPRIELLTDDAPRSVAAGEAVRAQLEKTLALRVRVVSMKWPAYRRSIAAGEYLMALDGWIGDSFDPAAFLEIWTTGHRRNTGGWAAEGYDALLREAAREADAAARLATLAKAEELLLKEAPVVPLFHAGDVTVASDRVRGLAPNLMSRFPVKYLRLLTNQRR